MKSFLSAILILNQVLMSVPFRPYSPYQYRIFSEEHYCLRSADRGEYTGYMCPANSACSWSGYNCLTKAITVGQICDVDGGCYCESEDIGAKPGTVKVPRAHCQKNEKCLVSKKGNIYFCGEAEFAPTEKCENAKNCHLFHTNAVGTLRTLECIKDSVAYLMQDNIICSELPLIKPGETCTQPKCYCHIIYPPWSPGLFSPNLIQIPQNSMCYFNDKLFRIDKFIQVGEVCPDEKTIDNCMCLKAEGDKDGKVCPGRHKCMLDINNEPECGIVKNEYVITPKKKCEAWSEWCVCKDPTAPNNEPVPVPPQAYCIKRGDKLTTVENDLFESQVCLTKRGCSCNLNEKGSITCKAGEKCVLKDGNNECQKLTTISRNFCGEKECFCIGYNQKGAVCNKDHFCLWEGACAATIIKPGEVSTKTTDVCVGAPISGISTEYSADKCFEVGMLCLQEQVAGRAYCGKGVKAGTPATEAIGKLCYKGDPKQKPEFIVCEPFHGCAEVGGKLACVKTAIVINDRCEFAGGCPCFNEDIDKTKYLITCPQDTTCLIHPDTQKPLCTKNILPPETECEDPEGCFSFEPSFERRGYFAFVKFLPKNHAYANKLQPPKVIPVIKPTEIRTLDDNSWYTFVNLGAGKPLYLAKCVPKQTVVMIDNNSRHICRNPEKKTMIIHENYCYNLEVGCICTVVNDKKELHAGEYCIAKDNKPAVSKDKKVYIECPTGTRCACDEFKNTPFLTQTKWCHIGGGRISGNRLLDALPKDVTPTSPPVLGYEELLKLHIECTEASRCNFNTNRALTSAISDKIDVKMKLV